MCVSLTKAFHTVTGICVCPLFLFLPSPGQPHAVCGGFISVCGGFISVCGGFISVCGGFISVCGGFISVCGGFISVCGGWMSLGRELTLAADDDVGLNGRGGRADMLGTMAEPRPLVTVCHNYQHFSVASVFLLVSLFCGRAKAKTMLSSKRLFFPPDEHCADTKRL